MVRRHVATRAVRCRRRPARRAAGCQRRARAVL